MNPSAIHHTKHFVIATMGTVGDMYPFLNIALTLARRGNRVTVLCPRIHEGYARQAGLAFQGLGTNEQYLSILGNPDVWHHRKGVGIVVRSACDGIHDFVKAINAMPTDRQVVILAHPLALPAAAIARSLRREVKVVGVYLAPANLRTVCDPLTIGPLRIPTRLPKNVRRWIWAGVDAAIVNPAALPALNPIRAAAGLPPICNFVEHMHGVADLSLSLFPAWFARPQPDWPQPMLSGDFQLYEPAAGAGISNELNAFLLAGDAPVVFTPGTGNRHAQVYFKLALEVCRQLNQRAIFLTSFREQVPPDLPATVLWQEYLPLRSLLPRVRALVHHGGIGTVAEALRAGVPQLVIPLAHDQFDNGVRIQMLGAGDVLISARLKRKPLLAKLRALLSSHDAVAQCREFAKYFAHGRDNDTIFRAIESL